MAGADGRHARLHAEKQKQEAPRGSVSPGFFAAHHTLARYATPTESGPSAMSRNRSALALRHAKGKEKIAEQCQRPDAAGRALEE